MRSLSAEEKELWAKVAATIQPLSRDRATDSQNEVSGPRPVSAPAPTAQQVATARSAVKRDRPTIVPRPADRHLDATLDGGWDRRLRQGKLSPDRTIDLHGCRLDDAWEAIDRGLERAIGSGERLVLLITGHAPKGEPPVTRGRIRGAVHDWLGASRHADAIAAVRPAAPPHGGRGALYLVLRRPR
ncbi:Smr/MutS family protein [Sphingomicrobium sp. XHP0239]|uniref:Smr/MutS family protein n=1 Tax=Sphingomicrobium maritimum TaxID=3133972 RepID=UPI0031CC4A4E